MTTRTFLPILFPSKPQTDLTRLQYQEVKEPTIEIVSHCYATRLPQYASALCYQLSSVILHPPTRCKVLMTVCCEPYDYATARVIKFFMTKIPSRVIILNSANELGRRSIGRNYAAKGSTADIVWFADVDQVFRGYCLDDLVTRDWSNEIVMVYPRAIKIHKDHAVGDKVLERMADDPRVVDIDDSEFMDKRYSRAIGGVQIVKGDFARQYGYLDGEARWQTPATKPFGDFRDDVAYRNFCLQQGGVVAINLPGMYRLRHSTTSYQ